MNSKNSNNLKVLGIIFISLIVLWVIVYKPKKVIQISEINKIEIKNTNVKSERKNQLLSGSLRDSIVSFSKELLGTPYAAASCSKDGFDCSGFVYYVFEHYKIQVPRSSIEFEHFGKEIQIESVKKGDILLFLSPTRNVIGHIGIVTNPKGMESDFIHSTSSKEMKVVISSLKQKGYALRFVKAIDVVARYETKPL